MEQRREAQQKRCEMLLRAGRELVHNQEYHNGLEQFELARLYAIPKSREAQEIEDEIKCADAKIQEMIEIEEEWLRDK